MRFERTLRRLVATALLSGIASVPVATRLEAQETKPTLYKRLGGYDALAAVTDDLIGRLAADPQLGRFFVGHSNDSLKRSASSSSTSSVHATGGPCVYIGPRHEDVARGPRHHRRRLGHHRRPPDRDARQVQGADAGEGRGPGRDGGMKKDIVTPKM